MSKASSASEASVNVVSGLEGIARLLPELQRLASASGQPGTMHGLELLLGTRFSRRKFPLLVCLYQHASNPAGAPDLAGAIVFLEYRLFGLGTGLFATVDAFGVRGVVAPGEMRAIYCVLASQMLLDNGGRAVLTTWRSPPGGEPAETLQRRTSGDQRRLLYASATRMVQDTLPLGKSAEETIQSLGKRTRVHLRAARRRFDLEYPEAVLLDATAALATASDEMLQQLNQSSLDVIDQDEFNHQVRSLCCSPGGFVLGLFLREQWIALIGGWRQDTATWIEWQCNGRGFEKLSLGSVLRTYLFEEEARRSKTHLSFHGGTSHSMLHRFEQTPVTDLLVRRPGMVTGLLVRLAPWLCARYPALLQRGNFLFNALGTPGLRWSENPAIPARAAGE